MHIQQMNERMGYRPSLLLLLVASTALYGTFALHAQTGTASSNALLTRGAQLAIDGRLAEAEATLQLAVAQQPTNLSVLSELAKVEGRLGKKADAVILFREVVAARDSFAAHRDLALALADNSQLPDALAEASRAVAINSKDAGAYLIRARILLDMERPGSAREDFASATRLNPTLADAWFFWSELEIQQHDEAKASILLEHVVALQPQNADAFSLLGKSLQHQGRTAEACEVWRKALAIHPDDGPTVYLLSQALRRTNPSERARLLARFEALQQTKEELDRQSAQVSGLGNQAYQAMEREDWAAADNLLRRAVDLCGRCALLGDLRKNLGLNACHRGDLVTGKQELTEALHLKPSDSDIVTALSWINSQQTPK